MKLKNLLFITLGILLAFSSCKKDDDEIIIGTWDYQKTDVLVSPSNPQLSSALQMALSYVKPDEFSLTFNENKTLVTVISMGGERQALSGTYELSGGDLNINLTPDYAFNVKYSLSKKKKLSITYTFAAESIVALLEMLKQSDGGIDLGDELNGIISMLDGLSTALDGVENIAFSLHFDKKK